MPPSLPAALRPPAPAIAAVVGALVAGLVVTLVWAGREGCDAVRGTPACGGWGGLMLAVIIGGALLGARLALTVLRITDAGLVAFIGLAVPLLLVLAFLTDQAFSAWMWLVLPALTAATFAGAVLLVRALESSHEDVPTDRA